MNTVFVILVVLVMPFTQFEGIISHLLGLWAGILILLKMLFQLHVAQDIGWHTNCTVSLEIDCLKLNLIYRSLIPKGFQWKQ
jgi:hypothetical protein